MNKLFAVSAVTVALVAGACGGNDGDSKTAAKATTTSQALVGKLPEQGQLQNVIKISGSKATRGEIPESGITSVDPAVRTQNVRTMEDFMTAIINDVNAYWRTVFNQSGIGQYFRAPQYNWYQEGTVPANACNVTEDIGAYYCPANATIYFSSQQAYDKWAGTWVANGRRSARPGDFSVATTIAHEFGHHVQAILGIDGPNPGPELQADCMAGGWGNSAYYAGILEAGDVEEGMASRDQVGDNAVNDPDHHGTGAQRAAAFMIGYNNTISACFR